MDEHVWDKYVKEREGNFFQSFAWGEFQTKLGRHVYRKKTANVIAQVLKITLPFGKDYLYIPMGPLGQGDEQEYMQLMHEIKSSSTMFAECELLHDISFLRPLYQNPRLPGKVLMVPIEDIGAAEAALHHSVRYKIRSAVRKGLVLKKENGWEAFLKLHQQTMRRRGLRAWSSEYFERLWETLTPRGMLEIWAAYCNGELLCAHLYVLFGSRATYLFGGSSLEHRALMAPHFLHWRVMEHYHTQGFFEYDFGGVDARYGKGLSTFKERFGGEIRVYPGAYRKIFRPLWYLAYRTGKAWQHTAHSS